jgi:hypothetical protein
MSNIGPNRGRRLRVASSRFAAMLIEELQDIGQFRTFPELDDVLEKVGVSRGTAWRYSLYPLGKKTRTPNLDSLQRLENKVAGILKRPSHTVMIYDNAGLSSDSEPSETTIGSPSDRPVLRGAAVETDFQLGYDADWPTYRRLKYSWPIDGVRTIDLYRWQWGVLWDRGEFSPEEMGVPQGQSIETFLVERVQHWKEQRLALQKQYFQKRQACKSAEHREVLWQSMVHEACRNFAGMVG